MLLLLACVDSALVPKDASTGVFDSGGAWSPPDSEAGATDSRDSGGVVDSAADCEDQDFPEGSVTFDQSCDGSAPRAEPDWVLVESWTRSDLPMPSGPAVIAPLNDDNGDGVVDDRDYPDVVVAGLSASVVVMVTALSGVDGSTLWSNSFPASWTAAPALGDIDGDGIPDAYVAGTQQSAMFSGEDGSLLWVGDGTFPATYGAGSIADLEGDGAAEVILGRAVLDALTGDTIVADAGGSYPEGRAMSVTADIDVDGDLELVAGNAVFDDAGDTIWSTGTVQGFPAVANFDDDPEAEVLVAQDDGASLYDSDGTRLWTWSYPTGDTAGPPAVADVNGDGAADAILPSTSGVAVLEADGEELWRFDHTPVSGGIYFDGASAYDLDGDGRWEVALTTADELILLDGEGEVLARHDLGGLEVFGQEPTFADFDRDGHVEIAVPFGSSCGGPGGVIVFEDTRGFTPGGSVWNEHGYSLTNIESDGSVPTAPDPNWLDANNFRAGPPMSSLALDRNLVAQIDDVCTAHCASGELTVWWQIGNAGTADVTEPVQVEFWGETDTGAVLLGTETVAQEIPGGRMLASYETTLSEVPPLHDLSLRIDVDGGGSVEECDEADNEVAWGVGVCGG